MFRIFSVNLILILLALAACKSSKKNESETAADNNGAESLEAEGVKVTGTVGGENSVDFVQAGDSVQIGGVNLLGDEHTITIDSVKISAGKIEKKIVYQGKFYGDSFSQPGMPFESLLIVRVDGKTGSLIQPVYQPSENTKYIEAFALHSKTMTIAAKLVDLMIERASAGEASATGALAEGVFSVPSLVAVAGSIERGAAAAQKVQGTNYQPINLRTVTSEFESASISSAASVKGISARDAAKLMSRAALSTLNANRGNTSDSLISAQIAVMAISRELASDEASSSYTEPGIATAKKLVTASPEVFASYSTSQNVSARYATIYSESQSLPSAAQDELESELDSSYMTYTSDPSAYIESVSNYIAPSLPPTFPSPPLESGSYTPSPVPSQSNTPLPQTVTPSPSPSASPSSSPSASPSSSPSASPSSSPQIEGPI